MASDNEKGEEVSATLSFDIRAEDVSKAERMAAALERMAKSQIEYNKGLKDESGLPQRQSTGGWGGNIGGGGRRGGGPSAPTWPGGMSLFHDPNPPTWPNGMPLSWNNQTGMNAAPLPPPVPIPFRGAVNPSTTLPPTPILFPGQYRSANYGDVGWQNKTTGMPGGESWDNDIPRNDPSAFSKFIQSRYGRFGAPLAGIAATTAAAGARNAADLAMFSGGTGSDAMRASVNSNFFSRQALGVYDTISDRGGLFAKAEITAERAELNRQRDQVLGRRGEVTGRIDYEMGIRRSETRSRIAAMNADPRTATMPFIDRSTVGGEFEFMIERGRQPIREQEFNIAREGAALRIQAGDTDAMLGKTREERKALDQRRRKASLAAGTDEDSWLPNSSATDAKRLEAAREVERIDADIAKNMEKQNELIERQKQLKGEILQNDRAIKENQLQMIQLQQREWSERAQTAAGQEQNVGRMGPLERQFAFQSALLVKNTANLDMLPDDVLGAAGRLIPKTLEKRFEEKGANDPITRLLKEQFGEEYRDSSKDARTKEQELSNRAITLKFEIQKELQEGVNKELLSDKMVEISKAAARQEAADIMNAALAKLAAKQNR